MDEITVFEDDKEIMIFCETTLLFVSEKIRKVPQFLISELENHVPKEIVDIYFIWSQKSNIDGDNNIMKINYLNKTYVFINHYWD